jgi:hypothetical protein
LKILCYREVSIDLMIGLSINKSHGSKNQVNKNEVNQNAYKIEFFEFMVISLL